MRHAGSARKLTVASVIEAAETALKERSDARPPRQSVAHDLTERSVATELDRESAAYIEAYVRADEDVQNETYLPRKLEARRVARICGIVSNLARQGDLPQDLASAFIRECKEQAARDLSGEEDLSQDHELGL